LDIYITLIVQNLKGQVIVYGSGLTLSDTNPGKIEFQIAVALFRDGYFALAGCQSEKYQVYI
jgi:hypothetical protein